MNPFDFFKNLLLPTKAVEDIDDSNCNAHSLLPDATAVDALLAKANAKVKKIRKADYIDPNGIGRTFTSKTPDAMKLSMWFAKTREELRIAAGFGFVDLKLARLYKLANESFPKELSVYGGFPTMPMLNARITQLKSLTRTKRATVKAWKRPALDAELETLRKRARAIYLACEWINSQLALGVYLDKKFGQHNWNEHTGLALVAALKEIRFPAV